MDVKNNITLDEQKKIIQIKDLTKVKPKKISGTNFGVILGVNTFQTPFQVWCDMMKIYKKPFEESKEKKAGKEIEPIQIKYIKEKYGLSGLITPTDKFGPEYFKTTRGDFFPMDDHFQGMWDCQNINIATGAITSNIEMKTTKIKNKEKWSNRKIPNYYLLQSGLYTYLSKTDKMVIVVSFLNDEHYENPHTFVPNEDNTFVVPYTLTKDLPNFEENYVKPAILWWDKHIVKGISPEYNEYNTGDVEIVKELKKQLTVPEVPGVTKIDIDELVKESPFY